MSLSVLDERTFEREMAPLRAIPDYRPKCLLPMDRMGTGDHAGIRQACVVDWPLEG